MSFTESFASFASLARMRGMRVAFGPFAFHADTLELRRDGQPLRLQRQPAMVLRYLLANPNRIIARDELIAHVWNDGRHVNFNQGLNYCMREVRKTLGDKVRPPQYIESVGRAGYRWIAPLTIIRDAPPVPAPPAPWGRVPAGLAASIALVVGLFLAQGVPFAPEAPRLTLAFGAIDWPEDLEEAFDAAHVLAHVTMDRALALTPFPGLTSSVTHRPAR